ncbi:MAG: alpha/beta fold hydrolase [Deltaproteobacteria bacterium]|nr:alpha/beta fold hydrolase [Deltaproteobacteria bacterium]
MPRSWTCLSVVLGVILVAGVGSASARTDTVPTPNAITGDEVLFDSSDGVTLHGNLFKAEGDENRGGILFVHEPQRSQRDWAYMAQKMSRRGFTALTFDLRGHGLSLMKGDEELDREIFMTEDYQSMAHDVEAAMASLGEHLGEGEPIHLIGADLGSSLSLMHAVDSGVVASVAMISPGLGYDDVNIVGRAASFDRPLLFVYSVEDSYSRKSAEVLAKEARGPTHTEVYYGVGHGTKMLSREPALEAFLQSWFLGTVITLEGRALADTGKPEAGEKGVEGGIDVEAEKRKLEEQRKAVQQGAVEDDEAEGGKKLGEALDRDSRR